MTTEAQPVRPTSILRGHKAQVHAAAFVRGNKRLVTGDADGYIVAWDLTIMRPRAVWQAHSNAILGIAGWGRDRLITHVRDNKLIVWKFSPDDESGLSTRLPLDPSPEPRPQPWVLYMLEVNTMNFCSFSYCSLRPESTASASSDILVAVPNTLASEAIDIYHLPSQSRRHTVKLGEKNGMVMALSLFHREGTLALVAGYENGQATVAYLDDHNGWTVTYQAKSHSQPILSLDISPGRDFFLTSSADAFIAKHPLPLPLPLPAPNQPGATQFHATQPDQDKILAKELTDLHGPASGKSLLSAALANEPRRPVPTAAPPHPSIPSEPLKAVNTRHAGQQSLRIRSDGRIFATAGWDSRIRLYSTKTLNEVAVLKWHQAGCYATAFAEVEVATGTAPENSGDGEGETEGPSQKRDAEGQDKSNNNISDGSKSLATVPKLVEMTVRDKRIRQARTAHWLAAGSKDGKVSVWDVF